MSLPKLEEFCEECRPKARKLYELIDEINWILRSKKDQSLTLKV